MAKARVSKDGHGYRRRVEFKKRYDVKSVGNTIVLRVKFFFITDCVLVLPNKQFIVKSDLDGEEGERIFFLTQLSQ